MEPTLPVNFYEVGQAMFPWVLKDDFHAWDFDDWSGLNIFPTEKRQLGVRILKPKKLGGINSGRIFHFNEGKPIDFYGVMEFDPESETDLIGAASFLVENLLKDPPSWFEDQFYLWGPPRLQWNRSTKAKERRINVVAPSKHACKTFFLNKSSGMWQPCQSGWWDGIQNPNLLTTDKITTEFTGIPKTIGECLKAKKL